MRSLLIAAAASLALAGCTTTLIRPQTAAAACADAQASYEAYKAYIEEGGEVSRENRRKIDAAKRTADRLCEDPEQVDYAAIILAAAQIAAMLAANH